MEKPVARLDNWTEEGGKLFGSVTNHPQYADGSLVCTTEYLWLDRLNNRAETATISYKLGYENRIPMAAR